MWRSQHLALSGPLATRALCTSFLPRTRPEAPPRIAYQTHGRDAGQSLPHAPCDPSENTLPSQMQDLSYLRTLPQVVINVQKVRVRLGLPPGAARVGDPSAVIRQVALEFVRRPVAVLGAM